jgi:membrane protein
LDPEVFNFSIFEIICIMVKGIRDFFALIKKSFFLFLEYNGLKLSAALSYYTVFSAAPLLIIIMSLAGVFFGQMAVEGKVYFEIEELVGNQTALQVQHVIQNIELSKQGTLGSIIGFVILFFTASGVFSEIQDSVNIIWDIKPGPKKRLLQILIRKLLSFSLLIGVGFILLVSLFINAMADLISERVEKNFPDSLTRLLKLGNLGLLFLIVLLLFVLIFKILPSGSIRWKDALVGSLFTSIFFLIGKFGIGFYLGNSTIGANYGAIASVLIIMAWVYYTSIILYFGAAFTRAFAENHGRGIIVSIK